MGGGAMLHGARVYTKGQFFFDLFGSDPITPTQRSALIHGNYVILCEVRESERHVEILRFLHGVRIR
jgi:hypothetical protein